MTTQSNSAYIYLDTNGLRRAFESLILDIEAALVSREKHAESLEAIVQHDKAKIQRLMDRSESSRAKWQKERHALVEALKQKRRLPKRPKSKRPRRRSRR